MVKASDNAYPSILVTEGTVPASPAAGKQRLYFDSTTHKLKRVNSSGTATDIESSGTGTTVNDRRWTAGSSETSIDTFADSSLDVAWAQVDGTGATSGNVAWTESADCLSVANAGADGTAFHGMMRALAAIGGAPAVGDAFVACVSLMAGTANDSISGIILSTNNTHGAGQQVLGAVRVNAASGMLATCYDIASWGAIAASAGVFDTAFRGAIHVRLVYLAANTWRTDISPDGVSWLKGQTTLSKTMTPTHVGLASSSYGSATKSVASYDYLRRVAGVT